MPSIKNKSRGSSRGSSRKSTASTSSPALQSKDDDFPSIVIANKPLSIKKKTPDTTSPAQSPRPEFLEPLVCTPTSPAPPAPQPWDTLGISEPEYHAMNQRLQAMYRESERKTYQESLLRDMNDPMYWELRMEQLEREREFFNKKRGWSAGDIMCVDRIDAQIKECEDELERISSYEDKLEADYD
jgi:hypothetical protein